MLASTSKDRRRSTLKPSSSSCGKVPNINIQMRIRKWKLKRKEREKMGHTHLRFYDPLHNRLHRSAAPSPWPRFFSLVALEPLPLPSLQAPAPRLTRPPTGRPPPPHPARFARPPGHPPRPPHPRQRPGYFISPFKLIIKMLIPLTPPLPRGALPCLAAPSHGPSRYFCLTSIQDSCATFNLQGKSAFNHQAYKEERERERTPNLVHPHTSKLRFRGET